MAQAVIALLLFLWASPVEATYYWASPGGSNAALCTDIDSAAIGTDPGSYSTIGQAARCATVAGDVVVVKAGTYTSTNHKIDTANAGNIDPGEFVSGTSDSVRTMIVGDPAGARPLIAINSTWYCTYDTVERDYITIRYLEIDENGGGGCSAGIQISGHHVTIDDVIIYNTESSAITFTSSVGANTAKSAFGRVTRSVIHDVRLGGSNGYCVYAQSTDITVEDTECYRAKAYGFHFYTGTANYPNNAVIRNNYVHDTIVGSTNFCGGIILYGTGHQVYRNRVVNTTATCPTATVSEAAIALKGTSSASIDNNLVINPRGHGIHIGANVIAGSTFVRNNILWDIRNNAINRDATPTYTHNACTSSQTCATTGKVTLSALTDCTASTSVYTQKAGSICVNAGTDAGLGHNGTKPDIGPYETMEFVSCEVRDAAPSVIRVTFANNTSPPMLPATGATTFTARKENSTNTVSGSVNRVGDGIYEIPVTSAYSTGDTADISWASGNLTATDGQPYVQTLTNQPCQNNVGGVISYIFGQLQFRYHGVYGPESTPDVRSAADVPTYEVVKGGAARIRIAVMCSNEDCPSEAFYLYYSTDGVSYAAIPDEYGAGNVAFCGSRFSNIGVSNAEPTTSQLLLGIPHVPGGVILRANAIPTVTGLTAGTKTDLEYCVSWDTDATGTYYFRIYEQDGGALTSYAVTPTVSITNYRGTVVFQ